MVNSSESLIKIGTARKPHGIKGAFIFISSLENLSETVLSEGQTITIKSLKTDAEVFMTLESVSVGQKILLKFKEVHSINEINEILPFDIYLKRSEFKEIEEEGEFYIVDLIGLKAVSSEDELPFGVIKDSYSNGAQEVLVIEFFDENKKVIELPFVNEFFPQVDLQRGVILVNLPTYFEE